jgi:hypothetical protein
MMNLSLHSLRSAVLWGCGAMFSDENVSRFRGILVPCSSTLIIEVDDEYSTIL